MTLRTWVVVVSALLATANASRAQSGPSLRQAMLEAEDGRVRGEDALAPLLRGLESRDAATVAAAVRGLGRLERPDLVGRIMPRLKDPRAPVRFEAAHALGQLAQGIDSTATGASLAVATIASSLVDLAGRERDATVLGAAARSLGRLPYLDPGSAGAGRAVLLDLAGRPDLPALRLEAARGLEAFLRISGRRGPPDPAVLATVRGLIAVESGANTTGALIRRLGWQALAGLVPVDSATAMAGLADPDAQVRRLALRAVLLAESFPSRRDRLGLALRDPSPMVRYDALAGWSRLFQAEDCGPVIHAVKDPADHVALAAITLLGNGCPAGVDLEPVLWPFVDSLTGAPRLEIKALASWHRGARALVAMARLAPERTRNVLSRAMTDNAWQVRRAAAEAAAIIGDEERLVVVAEDRDDNVRGVAVAALAELRGRGADPILVAQLARPDYQLVLTAADLLEGTNLKDQAIPALLAALRRITRERKDTSRDPRLAMLRRLAELSGPDQAPDLEPYLTDFDPAVARKAAEILTRLTGQTRTAAPDPLPAPPLSFDRIQRYRGARLRFTMSPTAGGGIFEVALDPERAPATVARLVERAQAGYYDGLTFHRVVPNFVIQGGSPNANEYAGDGAYLRDEIGPVAQVRGTAGISTRGRDTGDAQIFVNLVDNPRLDFNYTVWGWVVTGMEVVDAVLEGDVIDRVELVDGSGAPIQP